jgi:nucleoid DNA-binding protein
MAKKIQAYAEFGPRLEPVPPVTPEELIENIVMATNQSRGSVKAVLDELDVQIESGLKNGAVVRLPNSMHIRPIGKFDGSIRVLVRVNPRVRKDVNTHYRGGWRNAENIGKSADEFYALWNEAHPDDPIEP